MQREGDEAMEILIVHGSKRGGTAGLAIMAADEFTARGCQVSVVEPMDHPLIGDVDAIVVGGAIYAGRWPHDLVRFVKTHTDELRTRPTFFFSSGPLDTSASDHDIAPTTQVHHLMDRVAAKGHITFGGRLAADASGFLASAMAKHNAGDWRDIDAVRAWVDSIVADLTNATLDTPMSTVDQRPPGAIS
jgi:menaquinone-dependent protoporphyrinogen oxidase